MTMKEAIEHDRKMHREAYPGQYTHRLVGREVIVYGSSGTLLASGKVERVVNSRFGPLAIIEGDKDGSAYALKDCKIKERED
jgi:hypothetical protein